MYVIHTAMCRAYHDDFNSKFQLCSYCLRLPIGKLDSDSIEIIINAQTSKDRTTLLLNSIEKQK